MKRAPRVVARTVGLHVVRLPLVAAVEVGRVVVAPAAALERHPGVSALPQLCLREGSSGRENGGAVAAMPVDMRYYEVLVRPSTRSGAAVPFVITWFDPPDGGRRRKVGVPPRNRRRRVDP